MSHPETPKTTTFLVYEEHGEHTPHLPANVRVVQMLGSYRGVNPRGGLDTLPYAPVGGHPGNGKFSLILQLSIRVTILAMLIGSLVWIPENATYFGMENITKHAALAVCLMIFFVTTTLGGVLNTASAGISGCFTACVNIWLLRGFFPDGVTPGMHSFSTAAVVGWINLAIYTLLVLGFNCRMGFRMTALALNVGFMMCFLNPADKTVFSKNFGLDPHGAAVSAFVGVCIGSICAVLAVALPYPLGFASRNMKEAGKMASEDTCKLFIAAVKYFRGSKSNVFIDRQLKECGVLKGEIDALGANINDAYVESFDMNVQGTVRVLYEKHASMLGQIFEILKAMQFALASEDFGPTHTTCMEAIGEASQDLVDETVVLLLQATLYSEDGSIDASEAADLLAAETKVQQAKRALSAAFDDARRKNGKPVCKELMNESFFVFCLSAFGRLTVEYSTTLRTDPPKGKPFVGEMMNSLRELVTVPLWYHWRVVSRYWLSLMGCFLFSVHMDNFVPSCAITGVFLINTRVGPDVMAMIQGLLAVVVGIVINALMYSFSCRFGNTTLLMSVAFFYWIATIFVGKGSSSLANIGLLMAALSPFAIFKVCQADSAEAAASQAIGLWGGIRALLIAVTITLVLEFAHIPGVFTRLARESLDEAFLATGQAFKAVWPPPGTDAEEAKKSIDDALATVSAKIGDAEDYNSACLMEPRFWKCPWHGKFLVETCENLKKIRLDVMQIKQALCGLDGDGGKMIDLLNKVPEVAHMKADLNRTIEDGRELAMCLLVHGNGPFTGLEKLDTVEGLDELDGYDEAIASQSKAAKFPDEIPESMEDDVLVRLSIVYVMLDYLIQHVAAIIKGGVKLS
jgi:hypothetical protein